MKKAVRQTQKITNMAGERILSRVERDIGLTVLALILGLTYSSNGTRGYPVPWLGISGPYAEFFLLSLFIIFSTVFFIDLLVTAVLLVREPSADRQTAETSVIVNSVDYAEYEDDYDEDYSYTDASVYEASDDDDISNSSTILNESDYIPALVENKAGVRREQTRADKKTEKKSGNKSSSAATVIATIAIIASLIGSCVGFFVDSDEDYYDDWDTENIAIEDDSSTVNYNNMFDLASEALYYVGDDDYSQLYYLTSDSVTRADFDNLTTSDIQWSELWIRDELGNIFSDDGKQATVVYRLQDDSDNTYIAAFDYTGDDLFNAVDDDDDYNASIQLSGFSIFRDYLTSEDNEDIDFIGLSEQEAQDIIDKMDSSALSIGKSTSNAEDVMQIIYPDDL